MFANEKKQFIYLTLKSMSMYQATGNWGTKFYSTKASTAYVAGTLLSDDGTDIVPMTSSSTNVVGICLQAKGSGDATTSRIMVAVPKDTYATYMCDDVIGTMTAAMEGRRFDGGADAGKIDTGATTYRHAKTERFLSATKGLFSINYPVT